MTYLCKCAIIENAKKLKGCQYNYAGERKTKMKDAKEFVEVALGVRERLRKEVYETRLKFIEEVLDSDEAKGSYINYGYVAIDSKELELEGLTTKNFEIYGLSKEAKALIYKAAEEELEAKLEKSGWTFNSEGHLIPISDKKKETEE